MVISSYLFNLLLNIISEKVAKYLLNSSNAIDGTKIINAYKYSIIIMEIKFLISN